MISSTGNRKILIDSNLLVLYLTGLASVRYIAKSRRLQGFDSVDFSILADQICKADGIITLPSILTEVSNLTRKNVRPISEQVDCLLMQYAMLNAEIYVPTRKVAQDAEFFRLGVTDSAILHALAERDAVLITVDAALHIAALSRKLFTINFNHLRDQRADFQ